MTVTKVVFVEGNIGSGKSKFLSQVETYYGDSCQVIYEPIDTWTALKDENGMNILDHFYKDPKRYAYTFQNIAFMSKIKKLAEIDYTKKYVFVERSIWSDKHIFAKNCYLSKLISEIEYQVYNIWFSWIENVCTERLNPESIRFIYLKCSPETSFFRTNKRGRSEESDIKLDYLAQIHNQHEEWVAKDDVDWTIIDAEKDLTNKEQFISEYTQFINKIG
jgi:deoxyadenosine/deoxycytidine kinase